MSTAPGAPTVAAAAKSSYADTTNFITDMADVIDAMDPRDIPFLDLIGLSSLRKPCTSTQHSWLNDELIPTQGTISAAYTSGDNSITVGSTANDYYEANDIVLVEDTHYRVTTVNSTTLTVSLVSTSDASHADGSTIYNLGPAALDGVSAATTMNYTDIWSETNYTQIFEDSVSVTGTQQAVDKYGVGDEVAFQTAKKQKELLIKLERSALYGLISSSFPSSNAQPARRMGGMYSFIRNDSNANLSNASSASFLPSHIDGVIEDIYSDGGTPDTILVNYHQKNVMDGWGTGFIRDKRGNTQYGNIVDSFKSSNGELDILLNRYVKQSDAIIFQRDLIGIGPLKDRQFQRFEVPRTSDATVYQILGEYTMEVRCACRAHGWIYGLATS